MNRFDIMRKRSLNHDIFALSIMYDTLLFLCFVSLSGVVILPMFYQQHPALIAQHQAHEEKVDATLHALLLSTTDDFSYTTAGSVIDSVGDSIGLNTSDDAGIFPLLTDWFLGKEQCHKTYGQMISEDLASQFTFPLSSNDTISLNVFTQDFTSELIESIGSYLDDTISWRYSYNFTAYWFPIKSVPIGGLIELGDKPPMTQIYTAQRKVSLPFLPVFNIGNQSFVFSKQGISSLLSQVTTDSNSNLDNISLLLNLSNSSNFQTDNESFVALLTENLTFVATSLLTTGVELENNTARIPGLLELLIHSFLSSLLTPLEDISSDLLTSGLDYTFDRFDSMFSTLNSSADDTILLEIQSMIVDQISQSIGLTIPDLSTACDQLVTHLSRYVSTQLYDIVYSLMVPCAQLLIELLDTGHDVIDTLLDFIFDQLSLSTATVTLSIWEHSL